MTDLVALILLTAVAYVALIPAYVWVYRTLRGLRGPARTLVLSNIAYALWILTYFGLLLWQYWVRHRPYPHWVLLGLAGAAALHALLLLAILNHWRFRR